jgi:hypothetical protein
VAGLIQRIFTTLKRRPNFWLSSPNLVNIGGDVVELNVIHRLIGDEFPLLIDDRIRDPMVGPFRLRGP